MHAFLVKTYNQFIAYATGDCFPPDVMRDSKIPQIAARSSRLHRVWVRQQSSLCPSWRACSYVTVGVTTHTLAHALMFASQNAVMTFVTPLLRKTCLQCPTQRLIDFALGMCAVAALHWCQAAAVRRTTTTQTTRLSARTVPVGSSDVEEATRRVDSAMQTADAELVAAERSCPVGLTYSSLTPSSSVSVSSSADPVSFTSASGAASLSPSLTRWPSFSGPSFAGAPTDAGLERLGTVAMTRTYMAVGGTETMTTVTSIDAVLAASSDKWFDLRTALSLTLLRESPKVEAAEKLIDNHAAVLRDMTSEQPTTQLHLRRVPLGSAADADEALREATRRLLGRRGGATRHIEPCVIDALRPEHGATWAHAASFLSARIQSRPDERPGRTPDMSEAATAALRRVLQAIWWEGRASATGNIASED